MPACVSGMRRLCAISVSSAKPSGWGQQVENPTAGGVRSSRWQVRHRGGAIVGLELMRYEAQRLTETDMPQT